MMEHGKQSETGVNILYCGDKNIEDGVNLSVL